MNSVNRVMVLTASLALGATAFAGDKTVGEVVDDAWILAKAEAALVGYDASMTVMSTRSGATFSGMLRRRWRTTAASCAR